MSEQPNPLAQQLAEKLRDVQLPESVSWWPLATGWWLLLFAILVAITSLGVYLFKRWQANYYRKSAQAELNDAHKLWQKENNSSDYIASANDILKRTMLKSGSTWVENLNQMAISPLSDTTQLALAYECYKAEPSVNVETLHADITNWLKTHRVDARERNGNEFVKLRPQEEVPHA